MTDSDNVTDDQMPRSSNTESEDTEVLSHDYYVVQASYERAIGPDT
jgi:hypothetical protein